MLSINTNLSKKVYLSKGEDAVVLALASYKCGEGVHPVGKIGEVKPYTSNLVALTTSLKGGCKNA